MHDMPRRALIVALAGGAVAALASRTGAADEAAPRPRVALQGYDPVAYFIDHKPEKGSREFTAAFDDTTYWFKNAENRARFVADPDHYAPQFDGYCTITVSRGGKYEPDPEAWIIADGKLYVFSEKRGVPMFKQHHAEIVAEANAKWPALHAQP